VGVAAPRELREERRAGVRELEASSCYQTAEAEAARKWGREAEGGIELGIERDERNLEKGLEQDMAEWPLARKALSAPCRRF